MSNVPKPSCNHTKQCRNNVATLCCAKNRCCDSSRVTLYTQCQIPRETVSFVFPRDLMFPQSKETSGLYYALMALLKCSKVQYEYIHNNRQKFSVTIETKWQTNKQTGGCTR